MVDFRKLMTKLMTPEQLEQHDRRQAHLERERAKLRAMTAEELAGYAQRCVDNSEGPRKYPAGEPVYDNAMWHLIVPELIRRHAEAGRSALQAIVEEMYQLCREGPISPVTDRWQDITIKLSQIVTPEAPEITVGAALSRDGIHEWWSPRQSTWIQVKTTAEDRKLGRFYTRRWLRNLTERWDVWFEDVIIDVTDCLAQCWIVDNEAMPPKKMRRLEGSR